VAEQLLPTLREAVTNIGRHAEATRAEVLLEAGDGYCWLRVTDDGRGIDQDGKTGGGLGLTNMRRRAEKLDGDFAVGAGPDGGTELNWKVPLS
jgi:signal transduction histidine kinase